MLPKNIEFGTMEFTVPANLMRLTGRVLLRGKDTKCSKVFYTDGRRDCEEATWKQFAKTTKTSRRIMYQCSHCGYKSRKRSRFCGGCGNHMTIEESKK